jgi:hypothetical protein
MHKTQWGQSFRAPIRSHVVVVVVRSERVSYPNGP